MGDFERGSLLLPVLGLMVVVFLMLAWLASLEFRLYKLTRAQCPGCGAEISKAASRCGSCGEKIS